jgi:hypothetical protein
MPRYMKGKNQLRGTARSGSPALSPRMHLTRVSLTVVIDQKCLIQSARLICHIIHNPARWMSCDFSVNSVFRAISLEALLSSRVFCCRGGERCVCKWSILSSKHFWEPHHFFCGEEWTVSLVLLCTRIFLVGFDDHYRIARRKENQGFATAR